MSATHHTYTSSMRRPDGIRVSVVIHVPSELVARHRYPDEFGEVAHMGLTSALKPINHNIDRGLAPEEVPF